MPSQRSGIHYMLFSFFFSRDQTVIIWFGAKFYSRSTTFFLKLGFSYEFYNDVLHHTKMKSNDMCDGLPVVSIKTYFFSVVAKLGGITLALKFLLN